MRRCRATLLLCGLASVGCVGAASLRGQACESDAECGALLSCEEGVCEALLDSDESGGEVGETGSIDAVIACGVLATSLPSEVPAATDELVTMVSAPTASRCSTDADDGLLARYHWVAPAAGSYFASVRLADEYWALGFPEPIVTAWDEHCSVPDRGCGTSTWRDRTFFADTGEPIVLDVTGLVPGVDYVGLGFELRVDTTGEDEVLELGSGPRTGSTAGAEDRLREPTCDGGGRGASPEVVYRWRAPATGPYAFHTRAVDLDTVVAVVDGASPAGRQIACNDEVLPGGVGWSTAVATVAKDDEVFVVVEGEGENTGSFDLMVDPAFGCAGIDVDRTWPAEGIEISLDEGGQLPQDPGLPEGEGRVLIRFTAPSDGRYDFFTDGPHGVALLSSCWGPLRGFALPDNDVGGLAPTTQDGSAGTSLVAGESVLVVVTLSDEDPTRVGIYRQECSSAAFDPTYAGDRFFAYPTPTGECAAGGVLGDGFFAGLGLDDDALTWRAEQSGLYEIELDYFTYSDQDAANEVDGDPVTVSVRETACGGRQRACGVVGFRSGDVVTTTRFYAAGGETLQLVVDEGLTGAPHVQSVRVRLVEALR